MIRRARLVETRPDRAGRARGIVSSRKSGRRVGAHTYAVPPALRDIAATLWAGRWDLRGQTPHMTERVPDPCANIVFEVGNLPGSRVVGPWTKLWRRTLEGAGHVRGVKLRPGAVRALVDVPAHELADRIVPLATFFADVEPLELAVLDADDDAGFAALCDWLLAHRTPELDPAVAQAIRAAECIATDPAITSVERLARQTGIGVRQLQRSFRDHVGLTPKRAIRTSRLQELAVRIECGAATNLARLAAELGYTDQAHMTRDFKAITGRTPSGFARSLRE
jgi:AraC-like DNA-binding protein